MRLLVLSDSHGLVRPLRAVLALHPEADLIVHLGDGERDLAQAADLIGSRRTVQVCGNCDFASLLPYNELIRADDGTLIFCSHGHREHVKYGMTEFCEKAKRCGARIALYGHTHRPVTEKTDGIYLMNPGALLNGSYGMVDITPGGILCHTANLENF